MRIKKEDLEKHFEVIKTKVKRDTHPNEWRYCGKQGNEYKMAWLKYMKNLSKEQFELAKQNKLMLDEEKTREFLDTIQVNDVVGIRENKYKVLSKNENSLRGEIIDRKSTREADVTVFDIDYGLQTEFAEILWRNDEPYGVDVEEDVELYIPKASEEEKEQDE